MTDLDIACFCPHCGYDVRSLNPDTCPECGGSIDTARLEEAQIPWNHRKTIGTWRAFFKTIWEVSFHTKRFCQQIARPVDFREALRFRHTLVWFVFVGLTLSIIISYLAAPHTLITFADHYGHYLTFCFIGIVAISIWLFLYCWTGIHTYWFHPRRLTVEQQNRAIALSYYACGRLGFLPITVFSIGLGGICISLSEEIHNSLLEMSGICLIIAGTFTTFATGLLFLSGCLKMAHQTTYANKSHGLITAIFLPLTWLALAGVLLITPLFIFFYITNVLFGPPG